MAETALNRFRKILDEVFMLDRADLDFGIYRIMNVKRAEITRFLDQDLLPQVNEALGELGAADRASVQSELDKAIAGAKIADLDPESSPRVRTLRALLAELPDRSSLEEQVYSDLASFFRRYYDKGDFISLRRYKEGVYAIPYEGEEVKLHWANADQYYIKTSEYFRDYAFKLSDGRLVHFRLVTADSATDNNKPAGDKERRFVRAETDPVAESGGELVIRFEYRADPSKRRQADLGGSEPTEKNPTRTLLDRRLADYTARNTFDYFIHKDLGGFLRRELDFYIKSEVMRLDDVESSTAPRVEEYLARIRAIRRIGHKVIAFLAQIEDFQKKLWLKKKFVVETNYCVTLDRVPEDLYPEIAASEAQRKEWVRLFAIDEIGGGLFGVSYSFPLTVEFLETNPYLVLDTRFFDQSFKDRLLASIDNLDAHTDGLLIHSEGFQAAELISSSLASSVQCVYLDPPFNTSELSFIYKNEYRHSSWQSMMCDRLLLAYGLMSSEGVLAIAIDDAERIVSMKRG